MGALAVLIGVCGIALGQEPPKATHRIEDGMAQVVPEFHDPDLWIRHDLWVEAEFDSDDDGKPDRMHVAVTRPRQTETEGLKVPVIYISSPYFAGTAGSAQSLMWNVRQELGDVPPSAGGAAGDQEDRDPPDHLQGRARNLGSAWVRGRALVLAGYGTVAGVRDGRR